MTKLGILISGRGSNMRAIAEAIADGRLKAEIAVVISNRADAPGLVWAREHGINAVLIPSSGLDRESYDKRVLEELRTRGVELVCLAGYLRMITGRFLNEYSGRVLNIHPSLLPAFPGLDAQHQAFEHGVKISGCTVHFVDQALDSGPIIMQTAVPVMDGDTGDSLAARILIEEHELYPKAIALVTEGRYRIDGRRVITIPR